MTSSIHTVICVSYKGIHYTFNTNNYNDGKEESQPDATITVYW